MVKNIVKLVGIIGIIVLMIFLRVFVQQYREFKKGEDAFKANNFKDATTHYESAIHMYTPKSPFIEQSVKRMLDIASDFEKKNEYRWALITYENLRSSLYAVKSFYLPYPETISFCDSKIAELVKKTEQ